MEQKLEQLKALLEELGKQEEFNIFLVLDDNYNKTVVSGLCGEIRDLVTSLCAAFDSDITAFQIAMLSTATYAVGHGTLDENSELFKKIKEVMHKTAAARVKELELEQEKDNEE
jgi:hypothetical protein